MSCRKPDPRAGLFILLLANIGMFLERTGSQGIALTGVIIVVLIVYGCSKIAAGGAGFLLMLYCLQTFVLPASPIAFTALFSVFVNMTRRMLPCLLTGTLLVKKCSVHQFVAALRKMHLPQNLITAMAVTVRYFPAISEEVRHIKDAMKLQRIPVGRKIECYLVPIMLSATKTAEELSAAAAVRGIDSPKKKTCAVEIGFSLIDIFCMLFTAVGVVLILAFVKG